MVAWQELLRIAAYRGLEFRTMADRHIAAFSFGIRDLQSLVQDAGHVAIANWVTVLSLDMVVIGGGMTEALGERYLAHVREGFRQNVFPKRCQDCALVMTELAVDAALLGVAFLARDAISR